MFEYLRADLRHYSQHCGGRKPVWRILPRLLYSHPACAAVIWYRFGAWAWRLRAPLLGEVCRLVYVLIAPLVRVYSGVQIQPSTRIAPGLVILHFGGVVITPECEIGPNCVLHHQVNIVTTNYRQGARIGANFYAGVNVTIVGNVIIEDNVVCGAGSVVTRSVPANAIVAGVPARILRFRSEKEKWPKVRIGHHETAPYLLPPAPEITPTAERPALTNGED